MRILHVTPYYTPAYAFGGVVRSVEGMTQALARRGHKVTVLTTDVLDQTRRIEGTLDEIIDGVHVIRVPNISPVLHGRYNFSTPAQMRRAALALMPEIDLVHCHEFRVVGNLLVTPVAAQAGKPLVLSPHGTLTLNTGRSLLKSVWDRILSSAVALRFDHIIGLTAQEVADVQSLWPKFGRRRIPAGFSVVPNGVDPDAYHNLLGREAFRQKYNLGDSVVCLFMARLHPRKGAHILAEAFKQADLPNARLIIAGPDEGGAGMIAPDEHIILTGYLDGAERLAAFAAADLFALPAVGEGLPVVALEAMAAGLPVILSPGCNLPQAAQAGAGLEVEAQVEPLAEALKSLINNVPRRAQMSTAGRNLVRANFTWDAVGLSLENIYEALMQ